MADRQRYDFSLFVEWLLFIPSTAGRHIFLRRTFCVAGEGWEGTFRSHFNLMICRVLDLNSFSYIKRTLPKQIIRLEIPKESP